MTKYRFLRWSGINLFKNFPHFFVIHTVKGFRIVNEAEEDVFVELLCFLYDSTNVGSSISGSSVSLNPTCTSRSSWFTYH